SRSWEISTGHLSSESLDYLTCQGVNRGEATGMMFEVFVVPPMANHLVLGVKLIGTPWDEPGLRQEHLDAAVPADLVNVLHLAAAADVRFLVFDPDAPELEGLPYFLELSADLEEEARAD
ncbi:hypothetical protein ACGTN6_20885, partial [Halomonas sp. THAF12]|uniref:DUF5983 family protein n=1 Tax=Halomonas sp. B23F22_10 TaxID=3459515 RepID=UPI00373F0487